MFLQLNDIPAFDNVLPSKIFDYGSFDKPILAGVKGVAEKFLKNYLPHSYIFHPNSPELAIPLIEKIISSGNPEINNNDFNLKFSRDLVMREMINSILSEGS